MEEMTEAYPGCVAEKQISIKIDMLREYVRSGTTPAEYVDFHFFEKGSQERKAYISTQEMNSLFYYSSNRNCLPVGKYNLYQLFKPYFKRSIIRIGFDNSEEETRTFSDFISHHDCYTLKPVRGTKGHGVRILSARETGTLAKLHSVCSRECILEELIEQGPELACFHPQSVNTLRMVTGLNAADEFFPLFALFRSGRGESVVDNVGSGGIIASVDIHSGIIDSDGLCHHSFYERHPDTQVRFKGTKIPAWEDLLKTAEKAHRTIPEQRLIGWDFAWSEKGWDVVEANPAPSFASYQALSGRGIRPLLKDRGIL